MGNYAKVRNGIVIEVMVADAEFIKTFKDSTPGEWIKTSFNTKGGVHVNGKEPLRKNYAGIGGTYDRVRDAFIPYRGSPSHVLNEDTCCWESPAGPDPTTPEAPMKWDEETESWVKNTEEIAARKAGAP